jgi:hypothetical protein
MSLRPHFIKISDVLVRGIARSTVKREMLRSLRHIAETIDAVMVAEGIEHVEDVVALRDLGLRYGQGYYMCRPQPAFPTLRDDIRAELRAVQPAPSVSLVGTQDDDDEDDRDLHIPLATGTSDHRPLFRAGSQPPTIPRNAFGRAEDEITSDFALPTGERTRPRASSITAPNEHSQTQPIPPWQPLVVDEGTNPGEPLLDSLRRTPENAPEGESGPGRPGLN